MSYQDLQQRFLYQKPSTAGVSRLHDEVSQQTLALALWLDQQLPESRGKSLAITHLEEVRMWANQAVAMTQAELILDDEENQQ